MINPNNITNTADNRMTFKTKNTELTSTKDLCIRWQTTSGIAGVYFSKPFFYIKADPIVEIQTATK